MQEAGAEQLYVQLVQLAGEQWEGSVLCTWREYAVAPRGVEGGGGRGVAGACSY